MDYFGSSKLQIRHKKKKQTVATNHLTLQYTTVMCCAGNIGEKKYNQQKIWGSEIYYMIFFYPSFVSWKTKPFLIVEVVLLKWDYDYGVLSLIFFYDFFPFLFISWHSMLYSVYIRIYHLMDFYFLELFFFSLSAITAQTCWFRVNLRHLNLTSKLIFKLIFFFRFVTIIHNFHLEWVIQIEIQISGNELHNISKIFSIIFRSVDVTHSYIVHCVYIFTLAEWVSEWDTEAFQKI